MMIIVEQANLHASHHRYKNSTNFRWFQALTVTKYILLELLSSGLMIITI